MLPEKSDIHARANSADNNDAAPPMLSSATASGARTIAASLHSVSKSYKDTTVLEDINFDVAEGESLVLFGASGSGKTTILRIIAGLENPDTGRVMLHGADVTETPARTRHRRHLSILRAFSAHDG